MVHPSIVRYCPVVGWAAGRVPRSSRWTRTKSRGSSLLSAPTAIRRGCVVRGAERPARDEGGVAAGHAGDAMDTSRPKDLGQGQVRQDGGEAVRQHRRARPRGPSIGGNGQNASLDFRCTLRPLPHRDNDPAASERPRLPRARPRTRGSCPYTQIWGRGCCRAEPPMPCSAYFSGAITSSRAKQAKPGAFSRPGAGDVMPVQRHVPGQAPWHDRRPSL